jgi:ABC-type amino acid transport substrate-binding protein
MTHCTASVRAGDTRACTTLLISALLTLLFMALPGQAEEPQKLVRIATLDNYYPYCFRIPGSRPRTTERLEPGAESDQLAGFSWDMVRTCLHNEGYTIELHVAPWARVEHYVRNNMADIMFPSLITPARRTAFAFSRGSTDTVNIVMYANAPMTPVPKTMDAFAGKKIGVMRDWSFGPMWEKTHTAVRHPVDSILHAFQMLAKKRVDAVIGYEKCFDNTLSETGNANTFWKSPSFETLHGFLACRASDSFSQNVLSAFDRQARRLRKTGVIDRLARKWSVPVPLLRDATP